MQNNAWLGKEALDELRFIVENLVMGHPALIRRELKLNWCGLGRIEIKIRFGGNVLC